MPRSLSPLNETPFRQKTLQNYKKISRMQNKIFLSEKNPHIFYPQYLMFNVPYLLFNVSYLLFNVSYLKKLNVQCSLFRT